MLKLISVALTFICLESEWLGGVNRNQIEEVKVEFSKDAIGIESGQPIFSKETIVRVSNPTDTKINLYINDEEKVMKEKKIEITDLESGTYTIMIVNASKTIEKRTVGFTIQ